MQITIDTSVPLSSYDKSILQSILAQGGPDPKVHSAEVAAKLQTPESKPTPKAKPTPKPAPEPEPEEVVEAEVIVEPEEDLVGDEPITRDDAIALATKLITTGEKQKVKDALTKVGAAKVGAVAAGDLAAFYAALEA